jgi:class 3 adenylate cyclase
MSGDSLRNQHAPRAQKARPSPESTTARTPFCVLSFSPVSHKRPEHHIVQGVHLVCARQADVSEAFVQINRDAIFHEQSFPRDIYRTDTLAIGQRLKILSLTFLFSDLKGSTELYARVGDLVAFDLVGEHFRLLQEIISSEKGAVVKTIGDAVMATFETPDRAIAAAIRMREATSDLGAQRQHQSLHLKIGIHEGSCLAVTLNDQQDYFGQTVNIASRVQGLAASRAIVVTEQVVENTQASMLLESTGLKPTLRRATLSGIADEMSVYEIP